MAWVERVVEVPGGVAVSSRDGSNDLTGRDRGPNPGTAYAKFHVGRAGTVKERCDWQEGTEAPEWAAGVLHAFYVAFVAARRETDAVAATSERLG
jgi:hypothetical protein